MKSPPVIFSHFQLPLHASKTVFLNTPENMKMICHSPVRIAVNLGVIKNHIKFFHLNSHPDLELAVFAGVTHISTQPSSLI